MMFRRALAPASVAAAAAVGATVNYAMSEPDYVMAEQLRRLAGRARNTLEEPPAVLGRCARAEWRKFAGEAACERLEQAQTALKVSFSQAAQAWKASGGESVAPHSIEELAHATESAEAAVNHARTAAVAGAAAVPWHEAMGGIKLVRADGQAAPPVDAVKGLAGKVVGLYFTASWCGPCHHFSPRLVSFYNSLRKASGNFEVVVVGWDENESDRQKYARHAGMQWLALPHEPRSQSDLLTLRYGVQHIPCLVLVEISPDGKEATVLSRDGRMDIESRRRASWITRAIGDE